MTLVVNHFFTPAKGDGAQGDSIRGSGYLPIQVGLITGLGLGLGLGSEPVVRIRVYCNDLE
jgi:hypothetical protein